MPAYRGMRTIAGRSPLLAECGRIIPRLSASQTQSHLLIFSSSKMLLLPHWTGWVWPKPPYAKLLASRPSERKGKRHSVE